MFKMVGAALCVMTGVRAETSAKVLSKRAISMNMVVMVVAIVPRSMFDVCVLQFLFCDRNKAQLVLTFCVLVLLPRWYCKPVPNLRHGVVSCLLSTGGT